MRPITDQELMLAFDFATATDRQKLDRALSERERSRLTGRCTDYERHMLEADAAEDNATRSYHIGCAAVAEKAHPGYCNCNARSAVIADLERKLTNRN